MSGTDDVACELDIYIEPRLLGIGSSVAFPCMLIGSIGLVILTYF